MNLEQVKEKSIAMVVWNSQKENDVHVYLGKLNSSDGQYSFINEERGWKILLNDEQLGRLKPVSDDLKDILLNADYSFSMSMGDIPDGEDLTDYNDTGLKWHT
jgi:hypothetical protein